MDWFDEYELRALDQGDRRRGNLGWYHREAYRYRETDPDYALTLIAKGRAEAMRLHEPWWILFYDHLQVHALLHFKMDYTQVLDLAVQNTLQLRKSQFADFPRRGIVQLDLVSAYLGIDPIGYAEPIRQALDYLDQETPKQGDDRYLVLGACRQFAIELGQFDEAERLNLQALDLAADDPDPDRARHFSVFSYSSLCEIYWNKKDLEKLQSAVEVGETTARRVGHHNEIASLLMWRALLARQQGDQESGELLLRRATACLKGLGMPPDSSFYDAQCAYHELANDLEPALATRETELTNLRDRGRLARECECLLQRAWLLQRLGRATAEDFEQVRRAARRLRQPTGPLDRLERLRRGDPPGPATPPL